MNKLVSGLLAFFRPVPRGIVFACVLACVVVAAAAAAVALSNAVRTRSTVPRAFEVTNGPHLTVSALPGVDLAPVMRLPGISAASGPFPTLETGARHGRAEGDLRLEMRPTRQSAVDQPLLLSGTWAGSGSIVLERRFARTLRARPGSRITVSSARGPAPLEVAGLAVTTSGSLSGGRAGLGYVTRQTLARLAPNDRTPGSMLYLRVADPSRSELYLDWIRRSYPPSQVTAEDWHRLEVSHGTSLSLAWPGALAAMLAAAALLSRLGRPVTVSPVRR
jgi:hypothetical protein